MRTDAEIHSMVRELQSLSSSAHDRMAFWREIELILEALRLFIFYQY